jgi:ABC-2 type transport system permease protein
MGPVIQLYLKDMRLFFQDKLAVGLGFIVPCFMAIIFGFTFGGVSSNIEDLNIKIDVVDNDHSEMSQSMVKQFQDHKNITAEIVTEDVARKHVGGGKKSIAVIIPYGFSEKVKKSEDVTIKMLVDPSDQMETAVMQGLIQEVLFTSDVAEFAFPEMIKKMLREKGESETTIGIASSFIKQYMGKKPETETEDKTRSQDLEEQNADLKDKKNSSSFFSSTSEYFPVKVEEEQVAGQNVDTTASHVQAIVSAMVMFLMFGVNAGAIALLKEKKSGTLKRLLVSPLTVEGILIGKLLSMMTTGLMQIYFMLIVGWLVFHLQIWAYPLQIFLMAIGTAMMASGLGVMVTGFAKTEEQAHMISTLVILSIAAIGGAMVPRFFMPEFMKTIGSISPVSWAIDGFHNIFWYKQGFMGMIGHFGVLVGFAIVFLTIGSIFVRKQLKEA